MNEEAPRKAQATAAMVMAIAIWLFHFVPFMNRTGRLWAFNHLLFLPNFVTHLYIACGLFALLLFFPPLRDPALRLCEKAGGIFSRVRFGAWIVCALVAVPILWFLRMPTNFLGDGYTVINNIGNEIPVIFKWTEVGAIVIVDSVARLLPIKGIAAGEYAYGIVSVVSGTVTIVFFFGIAYELGRDAVMRLFIFSLLIFSGWTLLFFGYAENYPVLWPFLTGYLYFGIRYIMRKGNLLPPLLIITAALFLHLQVAFYIVSLAVLLVARGVGARLYKRHRGIAWAVLAGFVLVAVILFYHRYITAIEFRVHFLPLFTGRPLTPDYAIFSLAHIRDIINELSLTIPLWPVLLLLGWKIDAEDRQRRVEFFLGAFSLGGILFLLMVDPRLGMGRDWDLFAATALGPMLFLLYRSQFALARWRRIIPGLIAFCVILVAPYFITNLTYTPSIKYYEWLLDHYKERSKSGYLVLRDYYRNQGDTATAMELNDMVYRDYFSARFGPTANELTQRGEFDKAQMLADSMFKLDPYSREALNVQAMIYLRKEQYDRAKKPLLQSIRLGPYDPRVYANLGHAYVRTHKLDSALIYLRQAQNLDPNLHGVLEGLMMTFLYGEEPDSSLAYAHKLLTMNAEDLNATFAAGMCLFKKRNYHRSRAFFERYLQIADTTRPDFGVAKQVIAEIDRRLGQQP